MSDFVRLFRKYNGKKEIREYARAHVLGYALMQTAVQGLSRKSLEIVRLGVTNRIYQRLKRKNRKLIEEFVAAHPESKTGEHRRTIWTGWLQGMENAPEIVQVCHRSIAANLDDWEIVVITDENYREYVTFPDYIEEKYRAGIISRQQFSDLLRMELLTRYGGTWLDGTVFCSGFDRERHGFYLESDLFLFQNLKPGLDGHARAISSWMMTAAAGQNTLMLTRELFFRYWRDHNKLVDYFLLHDFFQMAIEAYPEEWKKVVPVCNSMPHVVLQRLFEPYDERIWEATCNVTPFHKLTYKYEKGKESKEGTYFQKIIGESKNA